MNRGQPVGAVCINRQLPAGNPVSKWRVARRNSRINQGFPAVILCINAAIEDYIRELCVSIKVACGKPLHHSGVSLGNAVYQSRITYRTPVSQLRVAYGNSVFQWRVARRNSVQLSNADCMLEPCLSIKGCLTKRRIYSTVDYRQ